jgi:integrase
MDTDDIQGYQRKFDNQLSKLRKAEIGPDRDAIQEFVRARDGHVNEGTMVNNINRLRLAAERCDDHLVELDKPGVDELLFSLRHDHGLAEGTVRNYRKALRLFYQHRDEEWADDIKIGASPSRKVDPNQLLSMDEINTLLDTAESARDKCLIALLADTGLRIGAIGSLRVGDVDLEGQNAFVSINENGNVKDASGRIPLTWSEGYVSTYLNVHPRRGVDSAALLHKNAGYYDGTDDGALEFAREAGIDTDRVKTHNFRKSAISRWIREGMGEQAIKHRACWDVDTDMFETYSGVTGEELNEQILDHYDLTDETPASRPDLQQCPRCQMTLQPDHDFCPGCAAPLSQSAAERKEDVDEGILEDLVAATDPEVRDKLRTLLGKSEVAARGHGSSSSE